MGDFKLYKRKVIIGLIINIILSISIAFLTMYIVSSQAKWATLLVLVIILLQILQIVKFTTIMMNFMTEVDKQQQENFVLQEAELEHYEKQVEQKVKQAEDLLFNEKDFKSAMGSYNTWEEYADRLLISISKNMEILVGIVYKLDTKTEEYSSIATYAYYAENVPPKFKKGEGLLGQVVKDSKAMFLTNIPEGYIKMISGLGEHKPNQLAFVPIKKENMVIGLVELAMFKKIDKSFERKIDEISEIFGNLAPNMEKAIINE